MSDERNLVAGSYTLEAVGDVRFTAQGGGVVLTSTADSGINGVQVLSDTFFSVQCGPCFLAMKNSGNVFLTCGPNGEIALVSGPPAVGPRLQMTSTSIKLSVGPPGVGASIELSLTGVDIKFGLAELKLSATGIEESMAAVSRKLGPLGHTLTAVESTVKCGVEGITIAGPIVKTKADAVLQTQAAIVQMSYDGIKKEQSGIAMTN
jgi:hypothetical protein